jgi:hypothetical protein
MRRIWRVSLAVAVALCATLAIAAVTEGEWSTEAGGSLVCDKLLRGRACHYDWDSSLTDAARLLDASDCESVNLYKTGATGEVYVYSCAGASYSASACHKILADTDGDGIVDDVTIDGSTLMRRGIQEVQAHMLHVDTVSCPSGTCRLTAECH